jgi:hypothetical protein
MIVVVAEETALPGRTLAVVFRAGRELDPVVRLVPLVAVAWTVFSTLRGDLVVPITLGPPVHPEVLAAESHSDRDPGVEDEQMP